MRKALPKGHSLPIHDKPSPPEAEVPSPSKELELPRNFQRALANALKQERMLRQTSPMLLATHKAMRRRKAQVTSGARGWANRTSKKYPLRQPRRFNC